MVNSSFSLNLRYFFEIIYKFAQIVWFRSGSGTQKIRSWIRNRNKSFRIHNTGKRYKNWKKKDNTFSSTSAFISFLVKKENTLIFAKTYRLKKCISVRIFKCNRLGYPTAFAVCGCWYLLSCCSCPKPYLMPASPSPFSKWSTRMANGQKATPGKHKMHSELP